MKVKNAMIDKEFRTIGWLFKLFIGHFSASKMRLFAKIAARFLRGKKDKNLDCSEQWISSESQQKLRVGIYKPKTAVNKPLPGILWLHGGGYAMGVPEQAFPMIKALQATSPCVVVAPDYTRSVEAPYPAALHDCYAALLWMKAHAEDLGIDPQQIFVGGDSAGGGLTAAVTLYARDKNEVKIAFQMPLYPMIDDRMQTASARDNDAPVWNSKSNEAAWKLYLGSLFGSAEVPEYAAPARALNYQNLPPTATFIGNLDPFMDETIAYVENLKKAGVAVNFRLFEGCYHGFEQVNPKAKQSQEAMKFILGEYERAVRECRVEC